MRARGATRALCAIGLVIAGLAPAGAGPARDYLRFTEEMIRGAEKAMPALTRAADAAAERLIAGGELYVGGADRGFLSEALGRAGGLMMVRGLPSPDRATKADVLLIAPAAGTPSPDADLCRRAREAGTLVIAFGAGADFPADHLFPSLAAAGDGLFAGPNGERICPTATVGSVVQLWAWTAEYVAACTRRGKMPTLWQSVMVPGARERNEPLRALKFHPETKVEAIPAGRLGGEYLTNLAGCVRGLREKELGPLERAGALLAETRRAGRKAHLWIMGHLPPHAVGGAGDPGYFQRLPVRFKEDPGIQAGDLVVALGYTGIEQPLLDLVEKAGAKAAWIIAPTGPLDAVTRRGDIVIDQHWRLGDAIVTVPGYDVRILPPSAVTQLACYWAVVGEAAARKGE